MSQPPERTPTEADGAQVWVLWRQDDNGNRFAMERSTDRAALEDRAAMYDARGHKQIYWVEAE